MQSYKWVPVKRILNSNNLGWSDYTSSFNSLVKVYEYH